MEGTTWLAILGGVGGVGSWLVAWQIGRRGRTKWAVRALIDQRNDPPLSSQLFLLNEGMHDAHGAVFWLCGKRWATDVRIGDIKAKAQEQLPISRGDWRNSQMLVIYRNRSDKILIGKINSPGFIKYAPPRIAYWIVLYKRYLYAKYNRKWFAEHYTSDFKKKEE